MKKDKNWKIEYCIPDVPEELTNAGINKLLALILSIRGYKDLSSASALLNCSENDILDPRLIKGMDQAVIRVKKAIQYGEKVAVYGDYDVDGITSTALLTDYLRSRGLNVVEYIPNRNDEGYGLNIDAIKSFKDDGITLVITVDCGITSKEEAEFASSIGIDLIVTDHHECKNSELPNCCAIIDCKQNGDTYPNQNLAGVGMAFKLVCAVDGNLHNMLMKYCDLLAIGTVADVMPLIGENRIFVKYGISKLRQNPRVGIKALFNDSSNSNENITATSISYYLAPRLNAAGRLDNAISAEKLILTQDEEEANKIAAELCDLNKKRQDIENDIWKEAYSLLDNHNSDEPIVISNDKWHPGVIGIAASRLAEHFHVPTVMIYTKGSIGKGSCRSYGGFNLFEALISCSEHLISYGGHALAAGLNIEADKIDDFRKALASYYKNNKTDLIPALECDLLITDPDLLSIENVKSLEKLEPYGNCNQKPMMCMIGVNLEKISSVGSGKHIKMTISLLNQQFDCIYFSCKIEDISFKKGDVIDIAFYPQINEFRDETNVQLVVNDMRRHNSSEICDDIKNNMQYLKVLKQFKPNRNDFKRLWLSSEDSLCEIPNGMLEETYLLCRKAFEETGLIDINGKKVLSSKKVDLDNTDVMKKI